MSATAKSRPRVAPAFYDAPPPARALPPLPTTREERVELLTDAVFAAILALRGLLTDRDSATVLKAATLLLDLDKTQIRHGRDVIGTHQAYPDEPPPGVFTLDPPAKAAAPKAAPTPPAPKAEPVRDESDPFVQQVNRMRKLIQAEMDAEGNGEVISWEDARDVTLNEMRKAKLRREELQRKEARTAEPPPTAPKKVTPSALDVPWQSPGG